MELEETVSTDDGLDFWARDGCVLDNWVVVI